MPEYLGYTAPTTTVDWASLTGELGEKIDEAVGTRGRERAAFDATFQENEDIVNDYEMTQNQTLNTFISNSADQTRDIMYEWNQMAKRGEITQAEYKQRMNNAMSYNGMLASATKTFDERSKEFFNRQQTGEGSGFELFMNTEFSNIADLKNKEMYTNPDSGKMYMVTRDENGNITSQLDVRQMNNPGNLIDNTVDLDNIITEGTKGWADITTWRNLGAGSTSTITDIRQGPIYENAKNHLIKSVLSNPRSTSGVLVDNGGGVQTDVDGNVTYQNYEYYSTDEQRDELIKANIADAEAAGISTTYEEQEQYMILATKDDTGTWQPELTSEQEEAARQFVDDAIEIKQGRKESGTPYYKPTKSSSTTDDKNNRWARYATIEEGWTSGDDAQLNGAVLPGFQLKTSGDEIIIYKPKTVEKFDQETGKEYTVNELVEIDRVPKTKGARSLSKYFYKGGTIKGKYMSPEEQFDAEKRAKRNANGTSSEDDNDFDPNNY